MSNYSYTREQAAALNQLRNNSIVEVARVCVSGLADFANALSNDSGTISRTLGSSLQIVSKTISAQQELILMLEQRIKELERDQK